MRILIVHAHPEPASFCSAMLSTARETLEQHGHTVEVSDLYAMNFDPVAKAADFQERRDSRYLVYALEQRHAWQHGTLPSDVSQELEKVARAELLILNFPVFWCSTPAILKGWIDRVLISGFAYGGLRFYDRGGLRGKHALVTATIGGQSHMFAPDGVHGEFEAMFRHLLRGTLQYTGMQVHRPFVAWHVPYVDDATRRSYLDDLRSRLGRLDLSDTLPMPTLDDFDDQLRPLRASRESSLDMPRSD